MTFTPNFRPRRLRLTRQLRRLVRETMVSTSDLIYPLFVKEGAEGKQPISSMPGQYQFSLDALTEEVEELVDLDIPAVILFGIPQHKDAIGSGNFDSEGIVPRAIRKIKDLTDELLVISDMCFCEYTSHGHCGIINTPDSDYFSDDLPQGYLLNDPTLQYLGQASVVHAQAGADVIAPSGMLDGMIGAIRQQLDTAGLQQTAIMSYAAKYSSSFYGPFREAAESPPSFGDRSQYQMDPANAREAITEVQQDVDQGADILMVKPALPYLDILSTIRQQFSLPLAAYQVSGEFSMIHAAAQQGWIDLQRVAAESLTSIKRAGADMILSYFTKDFARWQEA